MTTFVEAHGERNRLLVEIIFQHILKNVALYLFSKKIFNSDAFA